MIIEKRKNSPAMFFKDMVENLLVPCVLITLICLCWKAGTLTGLQFVIFELWPLFVSLSDILSSYVYGIYWSYLFSWFGFPNWNCSMWFRFFTLSATAAQAAHPGSSFDNSSASSSSEASVNLSGRNTVQNASACIWFLVYVKLLCRKCWIFLVVLLWNQKVSA